MNADLEGGDPLGEQVHLVAQVSDIGAVCSGVQVEVHVGLEAVGSAEGGARGSAEAGALEHPVQDGGTRREGSPHRYEWVSVEAQRTHDPELAQRGLLVDERGEVVLVLGVLEAASEVSERDLLVAVAQAEIEHVLDRTGGQL